MSRFPSGAFLSWHDARRSKSLAAQLGLELRVFVAERRGIVRHAAGSIATVAYLLRARPRRVWYQYSFMLGAVLGAYAATMPRGRVTLIADIHTKALRRMGPRLIRALVLRVKRWSLARCVAVLVTNDENARFTEEFFHIRPLVLPDPLPMVPVEAHVGSGLSFDVVFVCSFAVDEPLALICNVAHRLGPGTSIAITGDARLLGAQLRRELDAAARLTGFLPDDEYWRLLATARCIVVLSDERACLPCGAYEAIAIGHRPVVARGSEALRVFGDCATYTALTPEAVTQAILATKALGSVSGDVTLARRYRDRWESTWLQVMRDISPHAS